MKLTLKQKTLMGVSGLLLLLIITNPSAQAFKEHVGANSYSGIHKDKNLFVLSVYKYRNEKYIGLVGNFWEAGEDEKVKAQATLNSIQDSLAKAAADTSKIPPLPKGYTAINSR